MIDRNSKFARPGDAFAFADYPPAYSELAALFDDMSTPVDVGAWEAASVAADLEALAIYGDDPAIMGVAP